MRPDTGQVGDDRDAEGAEVVGAPDAGQLEELRRVDRPAGEDDLAAFDAFGAAALPLDVDGDRAPPLEDDPGHERPRPDGQVLPATDRLEVRLRGRQPPAVVDVAIERRETLLAVAVDVVGQVVARLLAGREEGLEQRVRGRTTFQDQRPVMAAPRIVGRGGQAVLHLLEVRQAMGVVPCLHPGIGRPALVVEWVATLEDLAVDARRAAEDLAARVVDAPAVHERLGFRLVHPVVVAAADREGQRRRHVDEDVESIVGPPGFDDQDASCPDRPTTGWPARSRPSRRRR